MAPTSRSFVKVVAVLVFITTVTAAAAVVVPGRGGSRVGSRGGSGGGGRSGYGGAGRSGSGVVVPVGGGSGSGGGSTGGNSGHSGSPHSTPGSSSNKNARVPTYGISNTIVWYTAFHYLLNAMGRWLKKKKRRLNFVYFTLIQISVI
ncbi:hypothetical protein ACFX13_012608 [Malus domestica]